MTLFNSIKDIVLQYMSQSSGKDVRKAMGRIRHNLFLDENLLEQILDVSMLLSVDNHEAIKN